DGFRRALRYENVTLDEILHQVDLYCAALREIRGRLKWVFVPTWVLPPNTRGLGFQDLRPKSGIAFTLLQMNLRLIENLIEMPEYIVLDAQKWIALIGEKAFSPKLWYLGKIPFSNDVFKEAVREIKAAVRSLTGQARKLIILDLDETLWGGIVG